MPRRPYDTDLADAQWERLAPLLPQPRATKPRTHDRREILNAILYQNRAGCAWRLLPHDFAPWPTVYDYFRQWSRNGTWRRIHNTLRDAVRAQADRQMQPSAAIVDTPSTKSTEKGGALARLATIKPRG